MSTRRQLSIPIIALLCVAVAACTGSDELTSDAEAQIEDGANRVILTRMDTGETLGRTSVAMDLYTDALRYLQNSGYEMAIADKEQMILRTKPRLEESGLALQIKAEVRQEDQGAKLIASARHANSPTAPEAEWQDVRWSERADEEAFGTTYQIIAGIAHDEIATSVE